MLLEIPDQESQDSALPSQSIKILMRHRSSSDADVRVVDVHVLLPGRRVLERGGELELDEAAAREPYVLVVAVEDAVDPPAHHPVAGRRAGGVLVVPLDPIPGPGRDGGQGPVGGPDTLPV